MSLITAQELKKLIGSEANLRIIDIRTEPEVETGRIPNAEWMDVSDRSFISKMTTLPKDQPYCLYCASGGRTMMVVPFLEENGFSHIYELDGGIMEWIAEWNPIVK